MAKSQATTQPKAEKGCTISWAVERKFWQQGMRAVVGVDEAGRGPLAGPVVAAAVMLEPPQVKRFPSSLRLLNDSKQLKEEEREALFEPIKGYATAFGIGCVSHEEIDRINILQATMRAMTLAVEQLAESLIASQLEPEMLLVDGNYFRTTLRYPFNTLVEGDGRSRSIAAASVLAKVTRDRMMRDYDNVYPGYNFARHKGYATREHLRAIAASGLCPIHRRSFRSSDQQVLFEDQPETL